MKKSAKALLMTVLALILVLGMVSVPVMAEEEPVEIEWALAAYESEINVMEEFKVLVEETYPNITLKLTKIPVQDWPDYYQKIIAMSAAGMQPDMGRPAERLLPELINNDMLYDITEYVEQIDPEEYYMAAFETGIKHEDRYYGIPSGVYFTIMYYNKDLFDAAGLEYPSTDWENPMTLEECEAAARAIAQGEGSERIWGLNDFGYPVVSWAAKNLAANGEYFYDEEGNINVNTPGHVEMIEWYRKMAEDGVVTRPTDTTILGSFDLFSSGKVGMVVEGTWNIAGTKDITDFRIGYAPTPSPGVASAIEYVDAFVIYSQTEHIDTCLKILDLMNGEGGWDLMIKYGVGGSPVRKASYDKYIQSFVVDIVGEENTAEIECFNEALNYVLPVPYSVYWEEADAQHAAVKDEWLLGNVTSQEFADRTQEIFSSLKDKAGA